MERGQQDAGRYICDTLLMAVMVESTCAGCGQRFQVKRAVLARGLGKFCSSACMGKAWRRGAEKTCPRCGKRFWTSPSHARRIYCSLSCSGRSHPDLPQYARRRVEQACTRCGAPYEVIPSKSWIGYCSGACRLEAKRAAGLRYGATLHKPPERLWALVDRSGGPDACWPFRRPTEVGYGRLNVAGKEVYAHRVAWELTNGPIAPRTYVLHRCPGRHNRACCNPAHLYLGTYKDNARDLKRQYEEGHLSRPTRDAAGHPLKRRNPVAQFLHELYDPPGRPE